MKLLLIGYSCNPNEGSEAGCVWHWAEEMSTYHEVWLVTFPSNPASVEYYMKRHPNPRLHIEWATLPSVVSHWHPVRRQRGELLHYAIWERCAYRKARQLHKTHQFDIVHHIGWNSISSPPKGWNLGIPFVWGPVGGGHTVPFRFYKYIVGARLSQTMRTLRVWSLRFYPPLRSTVRLTSLIMATNEETRRLLMNAGAADVRLFPDTGVPHSAIPESFIARPNRDATTVLWVGFIDETKCLPLALETIAAVPLASVHMMVAGDGPLRTQCETLAQQLGIADRVRFLGKVDWNEMWDIYRSADVFLFTSLKDSLGTVVIEAMSQGLPILTLDHQGVHSFVPPNAGIKVPVTAPAETVRALAEGLTLLASSRELRTRLGRVGYETARTMTWTKRAKRVSRWYGEIHHQKAALPEADSQSGVARHTTANLHTKSMCTSPTMPHQNNESPFSDNKRKALV